ncbi:MAG: hypothetical protein KGQ93_00680 [Cyanobacteria bacterium REEB459]|nr:hypothetical protein [Cyanobacteria bacterium REEB459]
MQQLNNLASSLLTYSWLSPDVGARQELYRILLYRPDLTCDQWFERYWSPPAVQQIYSKPLIQFAYHRLGVYTGLEVGRLRPSDRLVEDLQFPSICWFDWGIDLCTDFHHSFGIDISEQFDETRLFTFADLISFLNVQLEAWPRQI